MINIINKVDCCGCQACGDACPKGSISFHTDEEGMWYPKVNLDTCIDCHLCEKVCPIINRTKNEENSKSPLTYILQAPNPVDRLNSASGAAYTLLVREVFKRGGYVAGHIWNKFPEVRGYVSCNPEDLPALQSTKYLQSNVEGIYKTVKQLLKQGKLVLFSGCPCQNAAMRSYLRKDYDNLLMTDFTCMGIDSPLAFKKYTESLEKQFGAKIVFFKAKSKEVGWRYLTNKACFENGKSYFGINGRDANLRATFLDVLVRPSCYDCKFKGFPRVSDMTIGDYWRKKYDYDPLDDNTGTSYVMLHNKKAEEFFESVKPACNYRQVDFQDILKANKFALCSLPKPKFDRSEFYRRLHQEDFASLINEYFEKYQITSPGSRNYKKALKIILLAAYFCRKRPVDFLRFLHYNIFSKKISANILAGDILITRNVNLKMGDNSMIRIKGVCVLDGENDRININLAEKASFELNQNVIGSGTVINVHQNGTLVLGFKTILKENVFLSVSTHITVGEFSLIERRVSIDDTDSGVILFEDNNNAKRQIVLGTHTLVGQGSFVYGSTIIGDETIIAENAVVKGNFPAHITIGGNPAQKQKCNTNWKYNFENIWNYKN